jgi:FixJ family two-component response regulator
VDENLIREAVVVVIEDDASVRTAVKELIESVGLKVRLYASAGAFLEAHIPLRAVWCSMCGCPK